MTEKFVPFIKINFNPLGTITAPYHSIDKVHITPHTGIDYAIPTGTEIHAPLEGIVSRIVDNHPKLGKVVFIQLDNGYQYLVGHLSQINVHINETIKIGDTIGLSGSTGASTAPHLHFGAINQLGQFIDPSTLFNIQGTVSFLVFINQAITAFTSNISEGTAAFLNILATSIPM